MYKKRVKEGLKLSYKEYCNLNYKICNLLMDDLGIDKIFRINLGESTNA